MTFNLKFRKKWREKTWREFNEFENFYVAVKVRKLLGKKKG
jgi:hypothetical protein